MVLLSIVIGLGIAEILKGFAWYLRFRKVDRGYWVHSILVVVVFLAFLQTWWESWEFQGVDQWGFVDLLFLLAGPVCLYLIAHLLYPEESAGANLREYYYSVARPMYGLAAIAVTASTAFRPIVFGQELVAVHNATSFLMLVGFLVLAVTKREALHRVLVPLFLVAILLDTVLVNPEIIGR